MSRVKWDKDREQEREMASVGINQLESENMSTHEAEEGGKKREGSTLQWAGLVRADQSLTLSCFNKQGPSLQVQFLP